MSQHYIETFFKEKDLPYVSWDIDVDGERHVIDNELIIDLIKNCSVTERGQIGDVLRHLDFKNADINDYLKHLAEGYIRTNYRGAA